MDRRFEGKTAILTGSSRGMGLAIAARLVAEGARVVITARHEEALEAAVESLGGPTKAQFVVGKADNPEHQAETVSRAIDAFGSADLLVNNAGINFGMIPLMELDLGIARKTVAVNVIAPLQWTTEIYNAWMREHGGAIVNISSIGAVRVAPDLGLYGASKATLAHLTATLAVELAPKVRVNAVAPALIKTQFAALLYEGREEELAATYPLKRLGVPADVVGAVAFLLSDDASWITGQHLLIDGGFGLVDPNLPPAGDLSSSHQTKKEEHL
jgi:NAD(P)-dependent dehydrogenase (short-subunit alcohol dehydrogenase family)